MGKYFGNKASATDVIAHDIVDPVATDATHHTRLGWLIVLLGVGGFILWSIFAPLDKGVPITGTVTVSSNRKTVQHPTGGIIEAILVKEGDNVKAGQVLVRMNAVQAKAQAEATRVQFFTARAVEARLIAERDGKQTIAFPPELEGARGDPRVAANISLQGQLFTSRQSALHDELAATDENMAGLKLQANGLEESRDNKKQQLVFTKEQLDGMRDLAREGFVARNRLLDLERTYAQINGAISEDIGNIGRTRRQIAELALRRAQRQQDYQKEVRQQLTDTQRDAEGLGNRLAGLDFELANALVKAPVDGSVVSLAIFTQGGVVGPGARLMDLVPSDDPLIIEGQVPVNLIDKVHAGLQVELMFSAFNQNKTPHVPGIVTHVSADRMVEEKTGMPYYKLKAEVTPKGLKMMSKLEVRSGMPVDLFVKTGERTMVSYLLKPIFDRANTALSEE